MMANLDRLTGRKQMACTVPVEKFAEVVMDTHGQTREQVHAVLDRLLNQAAAIECGIMGFLSFRLGGDLSDERGTDGVVSVKTHGFA